MKARIFSLLLIVALLVSVSVFAVEAETFDPTNGYCEDCKSNVAWEPLPVAGAANTSLTLNAHYYLSADVTYDATANTGNYLNATDKTFQKICIHLNGQSWTGASNFATLSHGTKLNIMGTGTIAGAGTDMATTYKLNGTCTLNLYGGNHTSAAANHTLPVASLSATNAKLYIMGNAAVYDNVTSTVAYSASRKGGVISMTNGYLTISGGSVTTNGVAGKQGPYGGAIYITKGTAAMTGGTVSGGGANNGATIAVLGGSFTMSGTAAINGGTSSRGGGAVHLEGSSATFTMNGGTIQGGSATSASSSYTTRGGGAVCVWAGATFDMNGGTIQGKSAGYSGGSVLVADEGSVFNLNKGTIEASTGSTVRGGAVAVWAKGTLNVGLADGTSAEQDAKIIFDNAEDSTTKSVAAGANGGLIFNSDAGSTVNLYNGAYLAGGIANGNADATGGGAIYNCASATVNMYGGTITGCSSKYTGAINNSATFEMSGGVIENGVAASFGGNVYHRAGTFTMTGGEIKGGTAVDGGNVYVKASTFVLDGGTIENGIALVSEAVADDESTTDVDETAAAVYGNGGNVYNAATFTMTSGTISNGTETLTAARGGNVYNAKTFTMNGGTISGGRAKGDDTTGGGAVYNDSTGVFTMNDGATISGGYGWVGGNIDNKGTFTINTGATVTGGHAFYDGGGDNGGNIRQRGGTLTIAGGTVENGVCTTYGGNIMAQGGTVEFTDGIIQNGSAATGANIFVMGSTVNISQAEGKETKILGGTATSATNNGGSISMRSGTVNFQGGTIDATGATCKASGTAVAVGWSNTGTPTFNMTGGTITGGANENGGNVCVWGAGIFKLSGGSIENGTATANGGNVYVVAGTFEMSGGTIGGATVDGETVTSLGGVAANNGGNVYMADGTFTMTGGTISYGSTTKVEEANAIDTMTGGGNVYMAGGEFTVNGDEAKILNGTTNVSGGNIYVAKGTFTLTKGEVADGTATYALGNGLQGGGNIYGTSGNAIVNINGGKVYNGYAKRGGNIAVAGGAKLTVADGATITADEEIMSGAVGVNIFNRLSTVTINGGIIDGGKNTAVNTAGRNIYAHSGTFNFNGGKLINGMRNGTGVYLSVTNTTTVNLSGDAEVGQLVIASDKEPAINIAADYTGSVYFRFFTTDVHNNMAYGVALPTFIAVADGYANTASLFTGTKAAVYIPVAYGDITGDGVAELYATKLIKNVEGTMCDASGGSNDTNTETPKTVGIHAISEVGEGEVLSFATDGVTVELTESTAVDTNGQNVTINASAGVVVTLYESNNDKYSTADLGKVTVTGGATVANYVTNPTTGYRYIAVENNDGSYTAHRIHAQLKQVSIRPSSVGVYYSVEVTCDATLEALVTNYGVAVSLTSMPDGSFLGLTPREDILYTYISVNDKSFQSGSYHGALLTGIMTSGEIAEGDPTNEARANMPVYANAYVVIVQDNGQETLVMADHDNMGLKKDEAGWNAETGIAMSLTEIMTKVNEEAKFNALTDTAKASVQNFYNTWRSAANWSFATIENWVKPSTEEE